MRVTLFGVDLTIDETYVEEPPDELVEQLVAYERGTLAAFDLHVSFPADFTGRVMKAMAAIPYGETRTYGDLAAEINTAPIAVGGACGRNPLPIVVPCHRVIGGASIGGFSADTADPVSLKRQLLAHEGAATRTD